MCETTQKEMTEALLGKVMTDVKQKDRDKLIFTRDDGEMFEFYHQQDCCESVYIEDINGDLDWLVGHPILRADEETYKNDSGRDSETWTFYKFSTIRGSVTIRWYGESNGWYSESVDFRNIK